MQLSPDLNLEMQDQFRYLAREIF